MRAASRRRPPAPGHRERVIPLRTRTAGLRLVRVEDSLRLWSGTPDTFTVSLILDGRSEWRARGRSRVTEPGGVRFKEPGEHFRTVALAGPSTMAILMIDPPQLGRLLGASRHRRPFPTAQLDADADVVASVVAAYRRFERALARAASRLALETASAEMTDAIARALDRARVEQRARRRPRAALRRVREHLDARFAEPVSLEELAALAELHHATLLRAFREEFGLPPHAYQLERRVEEAQRLLYDGLGGAEVATRVGFYDQSHLIRHFKRVAGVTPREFLRVAPARAP
ncbi:MAG: helix-turn-helix transcriptional regulator [Myxococcales bacterium]|nr:helix-turn-helix transcriptional regulator [Myxococcales bacterium]